MRAAFIDSYGGPENITIGEQPPPKIGPDSVLVTVRAASLNPVDYMILRGYLDGGFPTAFPLVTGWDVAGEVAAVGPAVTDYEIGQQVIAYARKDYIGDGSWAEQVAVPYRCLAPAPTKLDAVHASCLPLAGLTALQGLLTLRVDEDDTVLIHNAGGGVGMFAVQLAKILGAATVYGTCGDANRSRVEGYGAIPLKYGDGLVERLRAMEPTGVDAIFDCVGGDALEASPQLLRPGGRLASITDPETVKKLGGTYCFVRPDTTELRRLAAYADSGQLRVDVQETFPLENTADAVRLAEQGHTQGKIVLTI
jgi:NADPH:quinone reductase-like Zn-dependent oxidoreductase